LREHLDYWPTQPAADEVRLWLARLLAGRREWQSAADVLQQVPDKSARFPECVKLLVHCYEKQLQPLNDDDPLMERRRAQLLAAATSRLQPIVTGTENRWPDSWSTPQRETAVALARLHLRYAAPTSPYAERLLVAALRGSPNRPDSAEDQAWESRARALLIEALARNGRAIEARPLVDQLANASIDSLTETMATIYGLLTRDAMAPAGDRELGELALSMLRLADARRSEFDASAARRLSACRAAALAAVGDRPAALAQFAALAAQSPDDGEIQLRYAAYLAASDQPPEMREALARWRQVESRSRRGGPRWRRARQARIDLLTRLGDRAEAEKLLQLTRLLYPNWDGNAPVNRKTL
jgi:hypothetical protein